jgi:hypothetical protein
LTQANKLSRTYAVLLDALNRHRGKGQQKVTVEHVHVHSGGQAVVGMVEEQPHAKQIAYAPQPPMWSADQDREPVPIARDAERPMSTARRRVAGRSQWKPECLQARALLGRGDCKPAKDCDVVAEHENSGKDDIGGSIRGRKNALTGPRTSAALN